MKNCKKARKLPCFFHDKKQILQNGENFEKELVESALK